MLVLQEIWYKNWFEYFTDSTGVVNFRNTFMNVFEQKKKNTFVDHFEILKKSSGENNLEVLHKHLKHFERHQYSQ